MIWQSTPTQQAVLRWLSQRASGMLMLPTSSGKTALALTQIDRWLADGADKALVVTPVKVVDQWAAEAAKWDHLSWLAERTRCLRFQELGMVRGDEDNLVFGDKRQAKKDLQAMAERIHVVSWSMFAAVEEAYGANWPYDVVVFDESDKLGAWTSSVTKAARRARAKHPRLRHVLMLAATPAANNRDKLMPQLEILKPGILGGSMTAFRESWCVPDKIDRQTGRTWSWKINPAEADGFAQLVAEHAVATEDPLGIPVVPVVHSVGDLPPEVLAWDQELRQKSVIKDLGVLAPGRAQVLAKSRQLGTGFVYRDEPDGSQTTVHVHDQKWEWLGGFVAEGRPMLIATEWTAEAEYCRQWIGAKFDTIDRKGARERFMAGELQCLGINVRQGHGLDGLQAVASDVVFTTVPLDLGLYIQVIGRLKRFGQKDSEVRAHLLVCGEEDKRAMNEVLPRKQAKEVDPILAACMLRV